VEQRRLLNFFVASSLFFLIWLWLQTIFPPPQKPLPQGADQNGIASGLGNSDALNAGISPSPPEAGSASDDSDVAKTTLQQRRAEWFTLGSMDPAEGYWMLVTLASRGGGIERIELTERNAKGRLKYRRVDLRSGYLGYLAPTLAAEGEGVLVQVVGPGTPAATAKNLSGGENGLRVGDRIVAIANQQIDSVSRLQSVLDATKPDQQVMLEVVRGESAGGQGPMRLQFEATLSEHPLDLIRLSESGGADEIAGNINRASCLMTLARIGKSSILSGGREVPQLISQHNTVWEREATIDARGQIDFRLSLPASITAQAGGAGAIDLQRSYQLAKEKYSLDLTMRVVNRADVPQELQYRLEGPNGLTLEGWWYSTKISPNFSAASARDLVSNSPGTGRRLLSAESLLKRAKKTPQDPDEVVFTSTSPETERQLRYIGIDAQYFLASYVPGPGKEVMDQYSQALGMIVAQSSSIPANQERATNLSFFLDSLPQTVPPQGALEDRVTFFAGPKSPELLETYGLSPVLEYGWFSWVAKPLSWLLHGFYAIVGNYAIAIIMLTLLVRGCMFPLSKKAAIHAQKMQELAPELKKITEKYKDDFEKRLKAQRELQQRVGFNPLSGCLPLFIQLPIFMGLYRALSVDIELRQAAVSSKLQWASNLAGPDMLAFWGDWLWDYLSGRGTGWLGPYFNILPIIVVGLFLVQQKMFMPPATDEQTAITQKVMTIMTLVMGLFFFRVPSGLCVYFITSSLWGIAERKIVKKLVPSIPLPAVATAGGTVEGTVVASQVRDEGKQSFADRIRAAAGMPKETAAPSIPPNKRKRPPGNKK